MTTEALQPITPNVVGEFGNRPIDFYMSMSHSLVSNKLEGVKATGFQMDKNGNFRFVFNMSITLLVQEKVSRNWVEARSMFASFTFKGKATTDKTNA